MKKSWIVLFTVLFGWMSMVQVAEAKRFGGGKSFGYSKSVPSKSYSTAPKSTDRKAAQASGTAKQPTGASKWLGPMAGLAAGGLLAAMLFGDGFEGIQFFDILMFALIAFMLFKLFAAMRGRAAQTQPVSYRSEEMRADQTRAETGDLLHSRHSAEVQPAYDPQAGSIIGSAIGQEPSGEAVKVTEAPDWFDAGQFVEGAKGHFVTLQKAWDNLDVSEIKSYCTPELFAAIEKEMQERVAGDNVTKVDTLDAEIADMVIDGDDFVVSIRFSGFIQEAADEDAHAFSEIWHIRRAVSDQGDWLVAGIQQIH